MAFTATNAPWPGQWVADRLGVALHGDGLHDLIGLALRRNPKRAHLLVSQVLGKHVPQRPDTVYGHAHRLGERVGELLGPVADRAVVLGYAETATGLGHAVADGIGRVPYLHSTRRPVPGVAPAGGFEEEHSHATGHLLLPEDPALLAGDGPLVLVDDEFSTGRTIRNTIHDLHERHPRSHYVIVALTDMRSPADHAALAAFGGALGARIDVVALASGTVTLPPGVLEKGQALVAAHAPGPAAPAPAPPAGPEVPHRKVDLGWPAGVPDGGRHGFLPAHRERLEAALPAMGRRLADALPRGSRRTTGSGRVPRVLVLGNEELMYAPLRLAQALQDTLTAEAGPGAAAEVRYSTTTRSPVLAVDDPGYAIRDRIVFPAHDEPGDEGPPERYAYNLRGFDAVVCVVDSVGDTEALYRTDGLVGRVAGLTDTVLVAVVPSHRPNARPNARPNGSTRTMSRTVNRPLPEPCGGPPSPRTRPTRWAGCSRTSPRSSSKRRPRSGRRPSRAVAPTTPNRCRWNTSRPRSTSGSSAPRWPARRPGSPAPSAASPNSCWPNAAPAPYWSRWPGPAPPSAS